MFLSYIAGPFRAPTMEGIRQNVVNAAAVAAAVVENLGWFPVTPHLNSFEVWVLMGAPEDCHEFWSEGDLALLDKCDNVVLVPGWEKSRGTITEVRRALATGKPVFQFVDGMLLLVESVGVLKD